MSPEFMQKIWSTREMHGMRATAAMSIMGLMTAMRVLPEDLYDRVMETEEEIPKGDIFAEIVRRFGEPEKYGRAPIMMHDMHWALCGFAISSVRHRLTAMLERRLPSQGTRGLWRTTTLWIGLPTSTTAENRFQMTSAKAHSSVHLRSAMRGQL